MTSADARRAALMSLALLAASPPAFAAPADDAGAPVAHAEPRGDAEVRAGMALAAEGRWEEALARFEAAHRLDPQPTTLFDVAQARLKTRRYHAALEAYRALLAARSTLSAHQVAVAERGRDEAEAHVARLTVVAPERADAITVDAARVTSWPVVLDPGPHVARALRDGRVVAERRVELAPGGAARIALSPAAPSPAPASAVTPMTPPAEAPRDRAVVWPGLVALGASAALVGAGAFFSVRGYGQWSDLHDGCGRTRQCADSDVSDARRDLAIGDVGIGLGIVAAVVAVYLLVDPPRAGSPPAAAAAF